MYQLGEVEETITVTIGILNNEANSVARPSRPVGMCMNTILNIISRGKHRIHGKYKSFFSVFSVFSVKFCEKKKLCIDRAFDRRVGGLN